MLHLLIVLKGEKKHNFYCIFDANTIYKIPDSERDTYKKILKDTKHFYQVTGGKRADDFLLELADSYQAPVISNDNYNDEKYDKYIWKSREFQHSDYLWVR